MRHVLLLSLVQFVQQMQAQSQPRQRRQPQGQLRNVQTRGLFGVEQAWDSKLDHGGSDDGPSYR